MKYMVFSLGVVLIMFSCKKLVKHVFHTKNRIFTCSGGTPAFFSIYDFFMLILKLWAQDTDDRLLKGGFRKKTDYQKPWSALGVGIWAHIQKNCRQFSTSK